MTVDLTTLKGAWKATDDPIINSFILRPDFQCYEGQEFVWRRFSMRGPWSRRHVREIGSGRTLCYQHCSTDYGRDWALSPDSRGVVDECPECRGMAEWYARRRESAGG